MRAGRGPWVIAGDWNCTPDDLRNTGWLELVGGRNVAPHTPTCGDRIIDFIVISECFGHVATQTYTIGDGAFYPHRPARLLLRAKTRNKVVRQL